jgi:NitT/TauT family transport system substrate-binding protein
MPFSQNRRDFLLTSSLAATAGVMSHRASFAAEPPPETTRIRLGKNLAICFAPLYVVEASLRAQGFTDVQYVESGLGVRTPEMVAQGDVDLAVTFAGTLVHEFDLGRPLIAVGGLHVGCYELFAREPIQSIRDLKGRRVSIHSLVSDVHIYVSIMAANIGLDPTTDIEWVPNGSGALESFAAGETDAFLGFPPEPQELRARGHRRVILNTVLDHPWSQY